MKEEIREGIKDLIGNYLIETGCGGGGCPKVELAALEAQETCLSEILSYLDSQGVRIVKELELPRLPTIKVNKKISTAAMCGYVSCQADMLNAHEDSMERLV